MFNINCLFCEVPMETFPDNDNYSGLVKCPRCSSIFYVKIRDGWVRKFFYRKGLFTDFRWWLFHELPYILPV